VGATVPAVGDFLGLGSVLDLGQIGHGVAHGGGAEWGGGRPRDVGQVLKYNNNQLQRTE
jgi:hypothetical protein